MSESIRGRYQFAELGRKKAQFVANIESEDDITRAIRPHLMSSDVDWEYDGATNTGRVYAGGRLVGGFTRLDDMP